METDTLFVETITDTLDIINQVETTLTSNVMNTIFVSLLIICFSIAITLFIFKFSSKFEEFLERLHEREHLKFRWLLSLFIFFYAGIKLIIIIGIITFSVNFLLRFTHLDDGHLFRHILTGIFSATSLTIITFYLYKLLGIVFKQAYRRLSSFKPSTRNTTQFKALSLIFEDKLSEIIKIAVRLLYYVVLILIAYFYVTFLFSFFRFTSTWSGLLFGYILAPVKLAFNSFINYLPNLFAIAIIFLIIKYLLKLVQLVFRAIEREAIVIPNFYKDWAQPTFKIVRFLIIVFGAIVIFPYLPGSNSPFFQGISIFVGVLFSLGSSSAISNIVAGVVLTYMRPFKEGDMVKIAETLGRVIEKTLLVTRVRTVKNVDITVPNSMVLSSHIINYSSSSSDSHLILHTSFSMGYDVPWRKVHELLINAALMTPDVLSDPKPFVLQKALDDYYTNYELNAYTSEPGKMMRTYSEMHQNIQDLFIEAGIDLKAPHFISVTDSKE